MVPFLMEAAEASLCFFFFFFLMKLKCPNLRNTQIHSFWPKSYLLLASEVLKIYQFRSKDPVSPLSPPSSRIKIKKSSFRSAAWDAPCNWNNPQSSLCNIQSHHYSLYRGFLPYANIISANFITVIFQNFQIYLAYAILGLFISLLQFFGKK